MANPFMAPGYGDVMNQVVQALVKGKQMGLDYQMMQEEIARRERETAAKRALEERQVATGEGQLGLEREKADWTRQAALQKIADSAGDENTIAGLIRKIQSGGGEAPRPAPLGPGFAGLPMASAPAPPPSTGAEYGMKFDAPAEPPARAGGAKAKLVAMMLAGKLPGAAVTIQDVLGIQSPGERTYEARVGSGEIPSIVGKNQAQTLESQARAAKMQEDSRRADEALASRNWQKIADLVKEYEFRATDYGNQGLMDMADFYKQQLQKLNAPGAPAGTTVQGKGTMRPFIPSGPPPNWGKIPKTGVQPGGDRGQQKRIAAEEARKTKGTPSAADKKKSGAGGGYSVDQARILNDIQQTEARLYGGTTYDPFSGKVIQVPKSTDPGEVKALQQRLGGLKKQAVAMKMGDIVGGERDVSTGERQSWGKDFANLPSQWRAWAKKARAAQKPDSWIRAELTKRNVSW